MTSERMKDWIVKTSKNFLADGVLYEPRVYTDSFLVQSDQGTNIVAGSPGVFVNGEQFPVVIKWMTAFAIAEDDDPAVIPDPRMIQRVGMRVRYHDQYYMSRTFAPIPLWHNTQTSAPPYEAPSTSAWDFDMPVVLSARDSLQVSVESAVAEAVTPTTVRVEVGFHGVGLLSQRPYFLQGTIDLTTNVPTTLSTSFFRNDGSEPIVLMGCVVSQTAVDGAVGVTLPLCSLSLQFKQVGNGTNANWVQAPITQNGRVPGTLLGTKAGFAVVHELPDEGWRWNPGEGVEIDMQNLGLPTAELPTVVTMGVALIGYIAVQ
jgi:hypothetical protein